MCQTASAVLPCPGANTAGPCQKVIPCCLCFSPTGTGGCCWPAGPTIEISCSSVPVRSVGPVRWASRACLSLDLGKPQHSSASAPPLAMVSWHQVLLLVSAVRLGDHRCRDISSSSCPLSAVSSVISLSAPLPIPLVSFDFHGSGFLAISSRGITLLVYLGRISWGRYT
ncbi:hypothetical protein GE09DRAFT_603266 [Coniochaeta sp. 2T2.1]|nr:hypothetical protein GE09DRAFT_603266 [Coniochaeta sp. 2T2.1]